MRFMPTKKEARRLNDEQLDECLSTAPWTVP